MDNWLIMAAAVMLSLLILFYRGNKKLAFNKTVLENTARINHIDINNMVNVSYHGGYPHIPKPQKMYIGLSDEYLLLLTNEGATGKIYFDKWNKIDKFTIRKEPDLKGRSIVLWGPFVSLLNKASIRHFVFVNYQDINGQENNILIEHNDISKVQEIFERFSTSWEQYKWRSNKKTNKPLDARVN